MRHYSKSTGCTYLDSIHAGKMPPDAVPIDDATYMAVIANPRPGKIRSHDDNGLPILIDPPKPAPPTREQIESARLREYADPVTGSDRYFAEAARLRAMSADEDEIKSAIAAGTSRYSEIQAMYPWTE